MSQSRQRASGVSESTEMRSVIREREISEGDREK